MTSQDYCCSSVLKGTECANVCAKVHVLCIITALHVISIVHTYAHSLIPK